MDRFDAIVIGAGQAGPPLASRLASEGRRVALVERELVGGTCVNTGCTPTKTMIASARAAHVARRADDWGVRGVDEVRVDMRRVRERKRSVVERFRSGGVEALEGADGLELVRGHARFVAEDRIEVEPAGGEGGDVRVLEAEAFFLDVGGRPRVPDLPGLEGVPWLDNASLMELDEAPGRLVVLGGGYVGTEFAQMFRRFGSEVAVVQKHARLLGKEDGDVEEAVRGILEEEGVEILLDARATRVRRDGDRIALEVEVDGESREVRGTHMLVATGRVPNTGALGCDAAGIELDDDGTIIVDDALRTSNPRVRAMGDAIGGPAFTHVSFDHHRIVADHLFGDGLRRRGDRPLVYTMFTDPQLGRVGLSEAQAREAGHDVRVASLPMTSVARAIETGETRGLMKAVVDAATGRILGAAVLAVEGGEAMAAIQVAMMGDLPWTVLRDGTFAHPTLVESLNNLFATLD